MPQSLSGECPRSVVENHDPRRVFNPERFTRKGGAVSLFRYPPFRPGEIFSRLWGASERTMNPCEKDFIDQIRTVLSSRRRTVIEHPPFSHAAVLVPLFKKGDGCHLLFTKRSDQVKYHKGEISFPGGVVDEEDLEL